MIHVSRDRNDDAAEQWAADEGFPWLTVLPEDVERSDLLDYRTGNSVPHYALVDAEGNILTNGASQVFSELARLTQ